MNVDLQTRKRYRQFHLSDTPRSLGQTKADPRVKRTMTTTTTRTTMMMMMMMMTTTTTRTTTMMKMTTTMTKTGRRMTTTIRDEGKPFHQSKVRLRGLLVKMLSFVASRLPTPVLQTYLTTKFRVSELPKLKISQKIFLSVHPTKFLACNSITIHFGHFLETSKIQ